MNEIQKSILLSQIQKVEPSKVQHSNTQGVKNSNGPSFEDALGVQFSKHAEKRLNSRQIDLSSSERTQLEAAMGSLAKKGAKDSLVLMGELAFIVNVPSKTVVTAMTKDQMKEHVFTNIDSTMLVT